MKKILIILITIFISGCSNITPEKELYLSMIEDLESASVFSEDIPFNIEVIIEPLTDLELMYRVIIDNPTSSINDIKAIVHSIARIVITTIISKHWSIR